MQPVWWLLLAVFAPLVTGLGTLLLPRNAHGPRVLLALLGPVAAFAGVAWHVSQFGVVPLSDPAATAPLTWIPSLNLNLAFLADGLGVFFALLVAGIGALIVLYTRGYFGPDGEELSQFYPILGFFTTAMLGIVLADHYLLTLLFWEATSVSSFLLIGWHRYEKASVRLAMQALFTTGMGGMALLGGLLLLGVETGTWRWSELLVLEAGELTPALAWDNGLMWAFVMIFLGAATKSAQFPWHYWLPGAMAAPTPVSAFLHSAAMVKAGVFLTARAFPALSALELWPWLILIPGAITMLLGPGLALNQHDLKRMFAYTTVSQLGLLMCVYGLGSLEYHHVPNIDWDISQIANHAFYKAPLFLIAGAFDHLAGTRMLPRLFGAIRRFPILTVVMLLAGYALAAMPGTISFQAKELFFYATVHGAEAHPWLWILVVMTVLTAMFNMAIFVRLLTTLCGLPGAQQPEAVAAHEEGAHEHGHHEHHHEQGLWPAMLWVPAALLVAFQLIGGLATPLWNMVFRPVEAHMNYDAFTGGLPHLLELHMNLPLGLSMLGMGLGAMLGLSPLMRGAVRDVHDKIYPALYHACVVGGGRAFHFLQTGHLRHYMLFVSGAFLLAFAGSVWADVAMLRASVAPIMRGLEYWPGLAMGALICITAVALILTDVRVLRVLMLGASGFAVVGMYIIYQAPDLVLTQLMFEFVSVILFVLVLRLLPRHQTQGSAGRWWRAIVGAAVGLAFGWLTLLAGSQMPAEVPTGQFYAQHADHPPQQVDEQQTGVVADRGAGGHNVVNVILVDFRGFDTLGEITVLALGAIGVWSLMPGRWQRREL
jgi:multicomponent K+:H+ antiporter subunit A